MSDRHQVRAALESALRTDADLEAFCVDYFPEVHSRFSAGMQRPAKISLLLMLVDTHLVADRLRRYVEPLANHERPAPRWRRQAVVGVVGLLVAGSLAMHAFWHRVAAPRRAPDQTGQAMMKPMAVGQGTAPPASPSSGSIAVRHDGDIRSGGNVSITAPAAPHDTIVTSRGRIEADSDVHIGVTAKPASSRSRRSLQSGSHNP